MLSGFACPRARSFMSMWLPPRAVVSIRRSVHGGSSLAEGKSCAAAAGTPRRPLAGKLDGIDAAPTPTCRLVPRCRQRDGLDSARGSPGGTVWQVTGGCDCVLSPSEATEDLGGRPLARPYGAVDRPVRDCTWRRPPPSRARGSRRVPERETRL